VDAMIFGVITVTAGSWTLFKLWTTPGADRSTKVIALVMLTILVAIVFGVRELLGWLFS
jgi:hypothetical protein